MDIHRMAILALIAAPLAWAVPAAADVPAAGIPVATPPVTGCPAGWETLTLGQLSPNYRLPARLDDPANGGNGDGVVCGNPVNATRYDQLCASTCTVAIIFDFRDDTLTPQH